jgi:hypothetical protein
VLDRFSDFLVSKVIELNQIFLAQGTVLRIHLSAQIKSSLRNFYY